MVCVIKELNDECVVHRNPKHVENAFQDTCCHEFTDVLPLYMTCILMTSL